MVLKSPKGNKAIEHWDRVHTALSAQPRRQLIVSLMDIPPDRRVLLPEAAMSADYSPGPDILKGTLYHQHLPLLEEYGYIEWTVDPFRAGRGPNFADIAGVFDALFENPGNLSKNLVEDCHRF